MRRYQLPAQVRLDAAGNGTASITLRHPLAVTHTRLSVAPLAGQPAVVKRPAAVVSINGLPFEDTYSGHRAHSDSTYHLDQGDTVECRWTGGDPGALATLILRGNT